MASQPASSARMPLFDLVKAIASQLIVLHHLIAYGPMAEVAQHQFPRVVEWLHHDARLAVQAFFVMAGFLAARALAPDFVLRLPSFWPPIRKRFRRLALPCFAAVLISVACAAVARSVMNDPSLPAAPSLMQLAAHALLLQDLLGYEALSAGVWYVAIDFQLFAMMVLLLWVARAAPLRHRSAAAIVLVGGAAAMSLFMINRDPSFDIIAPYFFGVYALGAAAFWASTPGRSPLWLMPVALVVLLALAVDFRERVAVAAVIALCVGVARSIDPTGRWPDIRMLAFLGRISFSVFLIHYPVAMLVNAAVHVSFGANPEASIAGLFVAWALSIAAGAVFHRWIEAPALRVGERVT
jgi:peptidoglycan/LPS O-acetylase OafA/YrhL